MGMLDIRHVCVCELIAEHDSTDMQCSAQGQVEKKRQSIGRRHATCETSVRYHTHQPSSRHLRSMKSPAFPLYRAMNAGDLGCAQQGHSQWRKSPHDGPSVTLRIWWGGDAQQSGWLLGWFLVCFRRWCTRCRLTAALYAGILASWSRGSQRTAQGAPVLVKLELPPATSCPAHAAHASMER